ncbi:metallophosphoesterase [Methylomicrobium sp. Wu6]|uniref:metallophosphoesterase n=1 Tax=Methylomicrobium sp. Wu6 TaxID=3107928 RepID=UPI002DD674E6|nr:metallophosphoesterase [Methylomicrobium sp. Wu6]MEC4750384.1 metallophosphoesterase [Methylomicrobium sp. Wu6]
MKKMLSSTALLVYGLGAITPAIADNNKSFNSQSENTVTLAVYGDSPYGCKAGECPSDQPNIRPDSKDGPNPGDPRQIEATPAFIKAINADPKVRLVLHVGDIHSGSQYCTLAYNRTIFDLWTQFKNPLVYTPGDNEWTDCQKSKEGGNVKDSNGNYVDYANGNPVANLALIRSIFFTNPGETLGGHEKRVISQAQAYDPAHPQDAEYVENVMWEQSGVLFVTLNIPGGSNNDADNWYGTTTKTGEQIQEAAQRTAADIRWLDAAFEKAQTDGMKAVVIAEQADMWDLDGTNPADQHIANYKPFIESIASHTAAFGKPVLLMNGDSHKYRSDNPLIDNTPCVIEAAVGTEAACTDDSYDNQPHGYNVQNFHRIVVHGSYFPLEYLRLSVDPHANYAESDSAFGPFTWDRVIP